MQKYLDIEDLVQKYVQPGHNWRPTITKIEEVKNPELRVKFLKASLDLFEPEPNPVLKFHGTNLLITLTSKTLLPLMKTKDANQPKVVWRIC